MNDRLTHREIIDAQEKSIFPDMGKIAELAVLIVSALEEKHFSRQEAVYLAGEILKKTL